MRMSHVILFWVFIAPNDDYDDAAVTGNFTC